jgi:hypothetical protein
MRIAPARGKRSGNDQTGRNGTRGRSWKPSGILGQAESPHILRLAAGAAVQRLASAGTMLYPVLTPFLGMAWPVADVAACDIWG